jgi:hypothetical protein
VNLLFAFRRTLSPFFVAIVAMLQCGIGVSETLEQEIAELNRIGKLYNHAWEKADQFPDEFVGIVRSYGADVKQMQSIYQQYKKEIDAKSDLGKRVQSASKTATLGIGTFMDGVKDFASSFQGQYQECLQKTKDDAVQAEKEKTPGYYKAALHHLEKAEWMITILVAFNGEKDPNAIKISEEVSKIRKELTEKEAVLRAATERAPKIPTETYTKPDLESLRSQVAAEWKKAHPKDKVLKIVFDHDAWKVNRFSRWNGATTQWQHVDKTFLELSVIVEKDSTTTSSYAAFVNKDNQSNTTTIGVDTKGSGFVVDEFSKKSLGL